MGPEDVGSDVIDPIWGFGCHSNYETGYPQHDAFIVVVLQALGIQLHALTIPLPFLRGPEEDRTMWAVQDLSRLLHCLSGWACRSYNLRCLHIAIRLGGREDPPSGAPHNTTQGNGVTDGNSVVVAVGGTSSGHQAALASAFVNKELNNVLMA